MSTQVKSALSALNAGQLEAALTEVKAGLRDAPGSIDLRWMYCQLLCLKQDWTKATTALEQLRAVVHDPQMMQQAFLTERLIEGERRRNEVWEAGRAPEFFDEIGDPERLSLEAWTHRREGDFERYRALIDERDATLQATPVSWQGQHYSNIVDLDEPTASFLEATSIAGEYFWIPWRSLAALHAEPPLRPIDFLWAPIRIKLKSGPELQMYANVLYPSRNETNEQFLLGLDTEWLENENEGAIGRGKKVFLVGDEQELTVHEFGDLEF